MKTVFISNVLVAIGVLAGSGVFAQESNIVARVGDTGLKTEEIRAMIDKLEPREKDAISRAPSLLTQSVRQLLLQRVVLKEALAKKWDKQPETVTLIDKVRDGAIVESYLQSVCKVDDSYPSDAELKTAYEANKESLVIPRQFKLAQIYVAGSKTANSEENEKAKNRMESIQKSLRQPNADFAAIAMSQSDDNTTKTSGGEIGWLVETQMQPEIRSAVAGLQKNGVSEPVRTNDGWHILKCLDTKESRTASLEEATGRLRQTLRAERTRSLRQAYLAKLVQQNPMSVNELTLSSLLNKSDK